MLTGCSGLTGPKVSEADIATKVALLKLTTNPIQATQDNSIILATVQPGVTQPTLTVTPTATKPATDPPTWLGAATWREPFNGTSMFYTTSDEYVQFSNTNDAFSMSAVSAGGWHSWSMGDRRIGNFYLEATFKVGSCSGNDKYGLLFRSPDYNNPGYLYGVSCDGRFSLTRWDSKSLLIDWKPATALNPDPTRPTESG